MSGIIFLIIRVIASPLVNLFQKKLTNTGVSPVFIVLVAYVFFSAMAIPFLIISGSARFNHEFWIYMVSLSVIDSLGNIFLVRSLKSIDLSIFGPLNAYKPVVAIVISIFLIHEVPSLSGLAGVIIIIAGSYILNLSKKEKRESFWSFLHSEGVGYRYLSIILTSIAAVMSKKVILISSPLVTLSYWSLMGLPVVVLYFIFQSKSVKQEMRWGLAAPIKFYFGLLLSFLFLQIFSLYTFKHVFIGYSLALFQLSAVISVFLGSKIFKEKNALNRYLASMIMILGALLIVISG